MDRVEKTAVEETAGVLLYVRSLNSGLEPELSV